MSDPRPLGPTDVQTHERAWNEKAWVGYAQAAAAVAACALLTYVLRLGFSAQNARVIFAFFYLAVFVSVWVGGRGPALFSIALSLVVADILFLPTALLNPDFSGIIPNLFFLGIALMAVFLLERSRRAERAAREARGSLETTLRSIGDAVISTDTAGRVVFMNPVAERLTGWTLADARERSLNEVFHIVNGQTRETVESPVAKVLREGGIVGLANHTVLLARDGSEVPIDDSGAPIRNAAGHTTGLVLVFHDITERKLAEAERSFLAAIVESSQDAVIGKTLDGTITSWNDAAEMMYGYSAAEAVGRNISLVVPEDRLAELSEIMSLLRRGEGVEHLETVRVSKAGARLDMSLTISPVRDASGRYVGASTIARDISAHKRAEEERTRLSLLVERERRRLRNLVANVPGVVWEAWGAPDEPEQRIDFVSDHVEKMLGYTVEEWLSTPNFWLSIVHPEDRERAAAEAHAIFESRTVGVSRFRWTHRDGHAVPVEAQSSVILDERGEPVGMRGVTMDITERKNAEERLRFIAEASRVLGASLDYEATLERLSRLSVAALADYCIIDLADADGAVRRVAASHSEPARQPLVERLREYPPDGERAVGVSKVLRTGEPLVVPEVTDEVLASMTRDEEHAGLLRELGLKSFIAVPLVARGRTIGALTFASTRARREYTAEDISYAQEIASRAALAIENARLYKRAQEVNLAKDEFLATLSHELRTPLTAILGWVHILRATQQDGEGARHGLEVIERNAEAQHQLIRDLLDVSRIITGKLRLDTKQIELAPVVEAAIDSVRQAADAKNIRLGTEFNEETDLVTGDPDRLQQVIWNLLSNAIKFTPKGGNVGVSVGREGSDVCIRVSDTGQGIPSAFLPHVFERFRQFDGSTTREHGGLGLGLAIVRHLVEQHGGHVSAESAGEQRGSTFTVSLPVAAVNARLVSDEGVEPHSSKRTSDVGESALGGVRVLIVDDQPDARELLALVLGQAGAEVLTAATAAGALELLERDDVGVLVSDVGMPGEDGYSLVGRVRALTDGRSARIPAVALTAYASDEDRQCALDAGFDAHVIKPVEPAVLVSVIADLVARDALAASRE